LPSGGRRPKYDAILEQWKGGRWLGSLSLSAAHSVGNKFGY